MAKAKKNSDYNSIFATKLRNLISEHETTITEVAKNIDVTRQAVSAYQDGSSQPTADTLLKIANYFNVSTDYLLKDTNIRTTDMTIKDICEYTGLLESSLEVIKNLNCYSIGDPIHTPVSSEKNIIGMITSEFDRPTYIINLLLNNPRILGLIYSYMCLFNDDSNERHIYQGDKGSAVLFELMFELRKLRDEFQPYYKEAFYKFYKKDIDNGNDK